MCGEPFFSAFVMCATWALLPPWLKSYRLDIREADLLSVTLWCSSSLANDCSRRMNGDRFDLVEDDADHEVYVFVFPAFQISLDFGKPSCDSYLKIKLSRITMRRFTPYHPNEYYHQNIHSWITVLDHITPQALVVEPG
ncbi:hypothetical protein BDN72DRAFT_864038 [Pluteus cervinus]|uniref:Uncharacterized protein n=1 Tax=Pluteus cervinus TaxID=181527 RepID=A0ACD3A4S2_9AGAR|nr:hypothetical protein BDN72DRAFT_864038 [Pluteus cervinus]